MRIAVVGASGRTGLHVVRHALDRGDEVTAVVRNPEKFTAAWSDPDRIPAVSVADARAEQALTAAFHGADAVAFCLGAGRGEAHTIHREAVRACLGAMRSAGVTRIVALSASGMVVQGDDPLTRYLAKPVVGRLLKANFDDLLAMESRLAGSDVAWTVVRPPRLTDQTGRGRYRARRDGNVRWGFFISRDDLALAMVTALHDDSSVQSFISVAG